MKALIVYYSLSGTTRAVAEALAKELAADIEKIGCDRYAPGVLGMARACYDSWRGNLPPIGPLSHEPSRYDLVVIGGPIWAFHPATPVRSYLRQESSRLPNVAFFLTHHKSAAQQSLRDMEQVAGQAPKATLVVRAAEVEKGTFGAAVSSFASTLRMSRAA